MYNTVNNVRLENSINFGHSGRWTQGGIPVKADIALQKQVLTTEWLPWLQTSCGYESFTLVLETNWIRQPEKQLGA